MGKRRNVTSLEDLHQLAGETIKFHYGNGRWEYAKLMLRFEDEGYTVLCEVWPGFEETRRFTVEDFDAGLVVRRVLLPESKGKVFSNPPAY